MKRDEEDELIDAVIHQAEIVDRSFSVFVVENDTATRVRYDPVNVVYGDTDSSYIDLFKKFDAGSSVADVVAFSDEVAKHVNTKFPQYMKTVFNCSEEQGNLIRTEREIVARNIYFVAKKCYIAHVVNKDGIACDKYKTMGLATKRTDTPPIVKEFLNEMLHKILHQDSFEDIQKAILEFKDVYYTTSFTEIGRPMSIRTLKKYEDKYVQTGEMKGFSYHIRATLFYNSLCGPNDQRIHAGDKIKVVYIKDDNHPDMKYMAIPADADVLPSFVSELTIDRDVQWKKVVKKINLYLIPLGLTYTDEVE